MLCILATSILFASCCVGCAQGDRFQEFSPPTRLELGEQAPFAGWLLAPHDFEMLLKEAAENLARKNATRI